VTHARFTIRLLWRTTAAPGYILGSSCFHESGDQMRLTASHCGGVFPRRLPGAIPYIGPQARDLNLMFELIHRMGDG
jgi:hypothetical protein